MFDFRFISDESGATAIEYVFIVAIVGFGLILAMQSMGPAIVAFITAVDEFLKNNPPPT